MVLLRALAGVEVIRQAAAEAADRETHRAGEAETLRLDEDPFLALTGVSAF